MWLLNRASAIQESCAGTLCENDTAPSPIQLQIAKDSLPQEGVDHESMCSGVQRESLILNS